MGTYRQLSVLEFMNGRKTLHLTADDFSDRCRIGNVALDANGKHLLLGSIGNTVRRKKTQKRLRFDQKTPLLHTYDREQAISNVLTIADFTEPLPSILKQPIISDGTQRLPVFGSGIKIRGYDPSLKEMKNLQIEGKGKEEKLIIVFGKTPIYFKINGEWMEYKLTGRDDQNHEYTFRLQDGDGDGRYKTLKFEPREFAMECKEQKVAMGEYGQHLLIPRKTGKERKADEVDKVVSVAKFTAYGDEYRERLSRLIRIVKRLESKH